MAAVSMGIGPPRYPVDLSNGSDVHAADKK
jgi:hypothetical protein